MNPNLVSLQPAANGHINVCLNIGIKPTKIPNCKNKSHMGVRLKAEVAEMVLRYVNHRERALKQYNCIDLYRANCIMRLRQRFADYQSWHHLYLKPKILGAVQDLHAILPGPSSPFHANYSKLVADLQAFAQDCHDQDFSD